MERVFISVVTEAELLCGATRSSKPERDRPALFEFLKHVRVLDWGRDAAVHYADIRDDLQRRGAMIGSNDLLIAAHARSMGAVLVTNNEREFTRVTGLNIENWTA